MPFDPAQPAYTFLTHTFSECVENHAGMQMIGHKRPRGFSEEHLEACRDAHGGVIHRLEHQGHVASVWVFRGGVDKLLAGTNGANELYAESLAQPFDTQYYDPKKRRVFNKHGRQNNCYADQRQEPDIPNGRGTVIAFEDAPVMRRLRAELPKILGPEADRLYAETNLYKDVRKLQVGIGFHGDTERSLVVGVRLGYSSLSLRFQWYHRCKAVSNEHVIPLSHGDIYVMSHKATGGDWRSPSLHTLRHGVGRKARRRAIGS